MEFFDIDNRPSKLIYYRTIYSGSGADPDTDVLRIEVTSGNQKEIIYYDPNNYDEKNQLDYILEESDLVTIELKILSPAMLKILNMHL